MGTCYQGRSLSRMLAGLTVDWPLDWPRSKLPPCNIWVFILWGSWQERKWSGDAQEGEEKEEH